MSEPRHPADDSRWPPMARPRRLNLGDLLFAVAIAALACSTTVLAFRSGPDGGRLVAFAVVATLLFAMQAAQWRLGGSPATADPRSRRELVLGIASYLIAMGMFVLLLAMAALFPDGAALVVLALILVALYLSTWD